MGRMTQQAAVFDGIAEMSLFEGLPADLVTGTAQLVRGLLEQGDILRQVRPVAGPATLLQRGMPVFFFKGGLRMTGKTGLVAAGL